MIRDVLADELWRQMGYYAPRWRFVKLFVAETNRPGAAPAYTDYRGDYVLLEKIKRGKDRAQSAKLRPTDRDEPAVSGGYMFRKDRL